MSRLHYALYFVLPLCASLVSAEDRTIDGTGNNLLHSQWGAAGTNLARMAPAAYEDGYASPNGVTTRPNARLISNTVVSQTVSQPNAIHLTDMIFQWGQFIDHDLDLTNTLSSSTIPSPAFNITIPPGDAIFSSPMPFTRSVFDTTTGTGPGNPRQQVNAITSYMDASMVYGSDATRAAALRDANGRLKVSAGNLLPPNTFGLPNGDNGAPDPTQFFVAGDVRANEQLGLTAMHTLFVREHNRLADQIAAANPTWSSDQIYQRTRKFVGAEVQAITYNEFLPTLLGSHGLAAYTGYNPNVDASVLTEFSTAFFRVGHTMLSPQLLRMQNDGIPAPGGAVTLQNTFFQTHNIANSQEVDYLLKGLCMQQQQEIDIHIVDAVRNFLFGEPIPGTGFDLAALNIQRGRDHGLPDYNTLRVAFGLPAVSNFAEMTSNATLQSSLQSLYGTVNNIDPWVGALSEDHLPGSGIGPLIDAALVEQFSRTRDGDRFFYLNDPDFSSQDLAYLQSLTLGDIIEFNTGLTGMQGNVFLTPEPGTLALCAIGLLGFVTYGARRYPRRR